MPAQQPVLVFRIGASNQLVRLPAIGAELEVWTALAKRERQGTKYLDVPVARGRRVSWVRCRLVGVEFVTQVEVETGCEEGVLEEL